jgi:glycosyltransferase involved in cell wall biosynthesis
MSMFQDLGSTYANLRLSPLRSIVREHAASADIVISQGGKIDDLILQQLHVRPEKIAWVPNCTPHAFGSRERARDNHGTRFLFVARRDRSKGLPLLLEAFEKIRGAQLNVIGDWSPGLSKNPSVIFHGPIKDRSVLRQWYEQIDYLVVPSVAEGMPTVILEAFAAGVPVIASDVGAIGELVVTNRTGVLLRSRTLDCLVMAIEAAAALSGDEYQQMSASAIQCATSEFSGDRVRSLLLGAVNRALLARTKSR